MRFFILPAALLPVIIQAAALPQMPGCNPQQPCWTPTSADSAAAQTSAPPAVAPVGGGLGLNNADENASLLASMTASPTPSPSVAQGVSGPPPGFVSNTGTSYRQQAESANEANPVCHSADDCNSICKAQFPNVAAVSGTCVEVAAPGQVANTGKCACANGQEVLDMLAGLGDMVCIAANIGINGGINLATYMIPEIGPEFDAAEQVFKIGMKFVKKGTKNCGIDFCPDHTYTVVDPNQFSTIEGISTCL